MGEEYAKNQSPLAGPSERSVLCSEHFDSSCFEPDSDLASQMGMEKRRRLKEDAIPTSFEKTIVPSLLCEAGPELLPTWWK